MQKETKSLTGYKSWSLLTESQQKEALQHNPDQKNAADAQLWGQTSEGRWVWKW